MEGIPEDAAAWGSESTTWSIKRCFKRYATKADYLLLLLGFLGCFIAGAGMPAFSKMFQMIIDGLGETQDEIMNSVRLAAIFGIVAGIIVFIATWMFTTAFMILGDRMMHNLKAELFQAIVKQEMEWFEKVKPGFVTSFLSGDLLKVKEGYGEKAGMFLMNVFSFVLSIFFGFYTSWRLTLVILAVGPLLAVSGWWMQKMLKQLTGEEDGSYGSCGDIATEVLTNIRTVSAFRAQKREVERYIGPLGEAQKASSKGAFVTGFSMAITMFVMFGAYALAFWYGSVLVNNGTNSPGDVMGTFWAVLIGAFMLGQAAPFFAVIAKLRTVLGKSRAVLDRVPKINLDAPGAPSQGLRGDIQFQNMTFRYPLRPNNDLFRGLNLDIPAGTKVAFVGHSGSGKSSLLALIQRLYDPNEGNVLVDGQPLSGYDLSQFRNQLGVVSQEPLLFTGTIEYNVRLVRPEATMEEIHAACRAANIHDTIVGLPEGYQTVVGDTGSQLSGGQRQRICIARAILRNPKILLLDEATSALDRGSEVVVQQALDVATQGRTVLVVAHRLVTIKDCNLICFVHPPGVGAAEGNQLEGMLSSKQVPYSTISEMGTHDELMARQGAYARMVEAQSLVEQAGVVDAGQIGFEEVVKPSGSSNTPKAPPTTPYDNVANQPEAADPSSPGLPVSERPIQSPDDEPKAEPGSLKRVASLNKPEICIIALGVLGAFLGAAIYPLWALVLGEILNLYFKPKEVIEDEIKGWVFFFLGLGLVAGIAALLRTWCMGIAGSRLTKRLRLQLFEHMLNMEMAFHDSEKYGLAASTTMLSSDTAKVHQLFGPTIGLMVQNIFSLLIGLVICFILSWKITLVILVCIPILAFVGALNMKIMMGMDDKGDGPGAYDDANRIMLESLTGIKTVNSLNLQEIQIKTFKEKVADGAATIKKKAIFAGLLSGLVQLVFFGTFSLAFLYGATLIEKGEETFGTVMKTVMTLIFSAIGLGEASSQSGIAADAKQAAGRVFQVMDRKSAIDPRSEQGVVPQATEGEIVFKSAKFTYPTRKEAKVLKGLQLKVPAGKSVALIGATGCGKSTIIQLIERFYDPQGGSVLIDGTPLESLSINAWRSKVALVGQEPVLFDASVADNIRYGRPEATDEEVIEAAKIAQIHETVEKLPHKYNTSVGQKGGQLSGGQRQRIAIARAILLKPSVLLLDEATAALDNSCEKEVQTALDHIIATQRMTVVMIAHRLTTIKNVDLIAVLHEGVVIEFGTHTDLYSLNGQYRRRYDEYF